MNLCSSLRLLAGVMVLLVVVLSAFVSVHWLWLGVFVSLNLIQSAFSQSCPATYILKKLGVQGEL